MVQTITTETNANEGTNKSNESDHTSKTQHHALPVRHVLGPGGSVAELSQDDPSPGRAIHTGERLLELYIKTFKLQESDWDVISEGLHWVYDAFPTFKRARMHGGNPRRGDVYGFTGWNRDQGYVSLHNPSDKIQGYSFTLDRLFGLSATSGSYHLSSPVPRYLTGLDQTYHYSDRVSLKLGPKEVRILGFSRM